MSSHHQIAKKLEQVRRRMLVYKTEWPRRAGVKALEWIDGNFRAQGYRDKTLIPWRRTQAGQFVTFGTKSSILIKTGKLRRGNQMSVRKEAVRIFNNVKYASVHNEGFKGSVNVSAHVRRKKLEGFIEHGDKAYAYGANMSLKTRKSLKNKKVTQDTIVKVHTRKMDIARRQFMPSATRGSEMLMNEVRTMTQKDIQKILKIAQ